jgi:phage terminase large subunit-like protein
MNQRIRHDGNAVLSWMIGNAVANRGGDNLMKLDKKKSKARIDGVVASVMACGRLLIAPEPVRSVYETQGLFVLG